MIYDVTNFGAVPDNASVNPSTIQSAIDACHQNGGGTVNIPAGTFVTGTLYLKSNVELHLEMNARLLASPNLDDYNSLDVYPENFSCVESEGWEGRHLIIAHGIKNAAITGLGTIDGGAASIFGECHPFQAFHSYIWSYGLTYQKDRSLPRPGQTVVFIDCRNIRIIDITIENSPCWCLFFHGCENIQVRGYKAYNRRDWANTDGIDIDTCKNVTVSDCIIDTGDDAIAIRCDSAHLTNGRTVCENITITNCVLASSSSVFRIGVGIGEIRNVLISNLMIHRGGKAFNMITSYSSHGHALIEDIRIHNIISENVYLPIYMREDHDCYIKNITISDYHAKAFAGCIFVSDGPGNINHISIKDMHLSIIPTSPPFTTADQEKNCTNLKAGESQYLFYLKNTDHISFQNLRTDVDESVQGLWKDTFFLDHSDSTILP